MIKLTAGELMNAIPALQELAQKSFRAAISYRLMRLMKEVEKEQAIFESARDTIVLRYAIKDENNEPVINEEGRVRLESDKIDQCNLEINELMATEIELNAETILIDWLEDASITPQILMTLEPLIQEV